ncbi:MAG: hydrogenase expression/formation protein HypC [Propionibacteriaceae bacterium]|jgi:hydrogenase expression/formation protein HypC|nr:hydantoin utilization protein [Propionibacteriaceae bacterium]MDX6323327.1 hydrogenase expression/formation protein HypC [Propionibacteriaceae bacterium]
MCLGIPGLVIAMLDGYGNQLALVDVEGAARKINIGMLDPDQQRLSPGDWVLIHMGFALEVIDAAGAAEAMAGLELMGRPRDDPPAAGVGDAPAARVSDASAARVRDASAARVRDE